MLTITEIIKHTNRSLKGKYTKAILLTIIYAAVVYGLSLVSNLIMGSTKISIYYFSSEVTIWRSIAGLVFSILSYIIIIPFAFSYFYNLMDLYRGEQFSLKNLYKYTISNFKRSWCIVGRNLQKLLVPIILIIISYIALILEVAMIIVASKFNLDPNISKNIAIIGFIITIISIIIMIISLVILYVKELLYAPIYYIAYDNPEMTALQVVEESARIMKGQRLSYFSIMLIYFMAVVVSLIATLGLGLIFIIPYTYFATMVFYDGTIGRIKED